MSRAGAVRQYGKQTRKPRAERLFAELPQSPVRRTPRKKLAEDDGVGNLSKLVAAVRLDDGDGDVTEGMSRQGRVAPKRGVRRSTRVSDVRAGDEALQENDMETVTAQQESPAAAVSKRRLRTNGAKGIEPDKKVEDQLQDEHMAGMRAARDKRRTKTTKGAETKGTIETAHEQKTVPPPDSEASATDDSGARSLRTKSARIAETKSKSENPREPLLPAIVEPSVPDMTFQTGLRTITWDDVCAFPDTITKIAEASYAEVYRVTNSRGTSIIKVIRLTSPLKPQTKAQERSGLVDEEPHDVGDLLGELRVSEWVADIPGFVVYKDRYVVRGKAPKALVETHRAFHAREKRADPDRLQFYPSPSRYLDGTSFLVVELGDAGTSLEDFKLERVEQVWDIFLLVAIALARAEDLILFEHRDLHEGNLCIRNVSHPKEPDPSQPGLRFGYSGLDITILDYGLSRAEDPDAMDVFPVAYDLEKDLGIFTSTHAPQCAVYRQMRSFLLRGDRRCLPAKSHNTPYAMAFDGEPIDWTVFAPYTNVLWLAYTYQHLVEHFSGEKKELAAFKRETREMWAHLNPGAKAGVPCFGSAGDVVRFAVESGWVLEGQVVVEGSTLLEREDSIIVEDENGARVRRSPRRKEA